MSMLENIDYAINEIPNRGRFINIAGLDHGTYWLLIIKETTHYILYRVPGTRATIGIGDTRYYSPEYVITEKGEVNGRKVVKKAMGEWTLRYTKNDQHTGKAIALAKLDELERTKS